MYDSLKDIKVPEGLAEKVIASNPAERKQYMEIREMLNLDGKEEKADVREEG